MTEKTLKKGYYTELNGQIVYVSPQPALEKVQVVVFQIKKENTMKEVTHKFTSDKKVPLLIQIYKGFDTSKKNFKDGNWRVLIEGQDYRYEDRNMYGRKIKTPIDLKTGKPFNPNFIISEFCYQTATIINGKEVKSGIPVSMDIRRRNGFLKKGEKDSFYQYLGEPVKW